MLKLWKVASTAVIAICVLSPIFFLVAGLWQIAVVVAIYFWLPLPILVYRVAKTHELPVICGGPRLLLAGRRHQTPHEKLQQELEQKERSAPYN